MGRSSLFLDRGDEALRAFAQVELLLERGEAFSESSYCNYVLLRQRLLCKQGRTEEALAVLTRALERLPSFPEFLYERGCLRNSLGDTEGAREDWNACLDTHLSFTAAMRDGITDALPRRALEESTLASKR
jgi:tetratricopeptide (TPR) repeat protein